jgi:hypothetical protein
VKVEKGTGIVGAGRLLVLVLLAAGKAGGVAALPAEAAPPGYAVDSTQAAEPRPASEEESSGAFTLSVRRSFPDSVGERLLGIAEAIYPPRGLLVRMAERNGYEIGPDTAGVPLWWAKGVGEARIPYALTAGTLAYYTRLIQLYRDGAFRQAGSEPLFTGRLVYRASIAPRDTFALGRELYTDAFVAHQELVWTYDDGTFEPLVVARRVVVLRRDGTVLAIDGDGGTREKVAISSHRGIGRAERRLH